MAARQNRAWAWELPQKLRGRALVVARATWIGLAVALLILATTGFVRAFAEPDLLATPRLNDVFGALGLDLRLMMVGALIAPLAMSVAVSWVIFWRRSRDPMALLFSIGLLLLHVYSSRSLLAFKDRPVLEHANSVVFAGTVILLALILGLFPDGRFVPRWVRWLPVGAASIVVAVPTAGEVLMAVVDGSASGHWTEQIVAIGVSGVFVVGLIAQIHRYRHVSSVIQRQQTKWVILPLGVIVIVMVAILAMSIATPLPDGNWSGWLLFTVIPIGIAFPVFVANAVLRYRLYDVDRFVSRTISYTIVVSMLVGVYASLVVALRGLLPTHGDIPVALSTLTVAMFFLPLARRVRRSVDRLFFRSHYDTAAVVARLAEDLRHTLNPDQLTGRTVDILQRTFEPNHVNVWLAGDADNAAFLTGEPQSPIR